MINVRVMIAMQLGHIEGQPGYFKRRNVWDRRMYVGCTEKYTNEMELAIRRVRIPFYPILESKFAWLPIKTKDIGWVWFRNVLAIIDWESSYSAYFDDYFTAKRYPRR